METAFSTTKKCPFCAEQIQAEAIKCKHCGEMIDSTRRSQASFSQPQTITHIQPQRKWSPGVAALLSFLIPGAGQIYKGNIGSGLVWMFFVVVGYIMLIIPGLILHFICIFAAASGDPYK